MAISPAVREAADKLFAKGLKRCARCRKNRRLDRFSKCTRARHGYEPYCRECKSKYNRALHRRLVEQPDDTARERFEAKIRRIRSGCWIWTAALNEDGHGMFAYRTRTIFAHVAARHIYGFNMPAGLCPYLKCGVPPCANPEHVDFCTRRELSLHHMRDNPFARNARLELCTARQHRLVDGVNIWWRLSGTRGVQKTITRWCLDCWKAKFPGTKKRPNRREDAERERDAKLLRFLESHVPRSVRKEMREEVLNELWQLWRTRKIRRATLDAAVRQTVRRAWSFAPDRLGGPVSLDRPVNGCDGQTWHDRLADELPVEEEAEEPC